MVGEDDVMVRRRREVTVFGGCDDERIGVLVRFDSPAMLTLVACKITEKSDSDHRFDLPWWKICGDVR